MKSSIKYYSGKEEMTKSELIEKCNGNRKKFNSSLFFYENLPPKVKFSKDDNLVRSTEKWLFDLKNKNKPLVLLFSGGIDSTFALTCMIENACPPDFILVYTFDPFNNENMYSPYNMESKLGIDYLNHLKKNVACLQDTKIWHIHLDSEHADNFFDNEDWPLYNIGYNFSLDTLTPWFDLPKISNWDEFTFIKGGNIPRFQFDDDGELFFYIVDLQLGENIDFQNKKCYDFVLDNKSLFSSICNKFYKEIYKKNDRLQIPYNQEHGNKYLLEQFCELLPVLPPQIDKRFSSVIRHPHKPLPNEPLAMFLNKTTVKSHFFYLRAEKQNPDWYKKYNAALNIHKEWIYTVLSFPGKISQKVPFVRQ